MKKKEEYYYNIPKNPSLLPKKFYNTEHLESANRTSQSTNILEWYNLFYCCFDESKFNFPNKTILITTYLCSQLYSLHQKRKIQNQLYKIPQKLIDQHNTQILTIIKNKTFTTKLLNNINNNITSLYVSQTITYAYLDTLRKYFSSIISSQKISNTFVKPLPINDNSDEYIFTRDLAKNFLPFVDISFLEKNRFIHKKK